MMGGKVLSSFPSPCSRVLEDLATNKMQRNKEKSKRSSKLSGSVTLFLLGTNVLL